MAMAPITNPAVVAAAEYTICLGELADGDAIRVLPACGHCFHAGCIQRWLAGGRRSSCPTCRAPDAVATAAAAAARARSRDADCAQRVAYAVLAGLQLISLVLALIQATVRYFKVKK